MENKNPENTPLDEKKKLQSASNLTMDKSGAQTSFASSECVVTDRTADCSCITGNESEVKEESNDSSASESFDSAFENENLSFQSSPSFHTDVTADQSASDIVSISMISADLMTTSDEEESVTGQTEQPSLKDASCRQTLPSFFKMIAEESVKAENLPNFSVDLQRDIRSVHKVLSSAGEALAASFLTDSVVLSPSTSPETSPRMVTQASQSTGVSDFKDSNLTKNETNEASNRYGKNLRKFLKDIEPQNCTDKGSICKEISDLVECKSKEVTPNFSIKSELESNGKTCFSSNPLKKEDILPHDLVEMKAYSGRHASPSVTEACASEVGNLQSKQVDFCSPKAVLGTFKVPESPTLSRKSPKRFKSPKLISPGNSKYMGTSVVKKPKRPTSLNLSPRTAFYDFCPSGSGSILRLSRSLPDIRELPKKEDKRASMNIEDLKDNRCVKSLFTGNVKPRSVSPNPLSPSNAEQVKKEISFTQPDILNEAGKDTFQDQLSVKTQSLMPDKLLSCDKVKARKKLTFTSGSCKNTEDSAMEVELSSDSDISETPSPTNVTSDILKSSTDEENWPVTGKSTFESSPRKRKSSSPEIEFSSSSFPKKTRLVKSHNTERTTISNLSDSELEGGREKIETTHTHTHHIHIHTVMDPASKSTEGTLGSLELCAKDHSPIKDTCMSDFNNDSDN